MESSLTGKNLTETQRVVALECIYNLTSKHKKYKQHADLIMEEVANYQSCEGLFAKDFVLRSQNLDKPGQAFGGMEYVAHRNLVFWL